MPCFAECNTLNGLVSEVFIRFFVETVGHYSLFLTQNEKGERAFQREAFRKSVASKSIRRFLEVFMESQMFAGFIQDRELRKCRAKGKGGFLSRSMAAPAGTAPVLSAVVYGQGHDKPSQTVTDKPSQPVCLLCVGRRWAVVGGSQRLWPQYSHRVPQNTQEAGNGAAATSAGLRCQSSAARAPRVKPHAPARRSPAASVTACDRYDCEHAWRRPRRGTGPPLQRPLQDWREWGPAGLSASPARSPVRDRCSRSVGRWRP